MVRKVTSGGDQGEQSYAKVTLEDLNRLWDLVDSVEVKGIDLCGDDCGAYGLVLYVDVAVKINEWMNSLNMEVSE